MQPAKPRTSRRRPVAGIATALMCALAGGAVWCLLSLYSRSDLALLAFAVALPIVWVLRANGYAGSRTGALLAGACVLLASVYSFYLQAVAGIAGMLGVSMRIAFQRMGPAMTFDVARADLGAWDMALVAAAVAFAAWQMLRAAAPRGA